MLLDALLGDFMSCGAKLLFHLGCCIYGAGKKDRSFEAEIQVFPQVCAGSFSYYLP